MIPQRPHYEPTAFVPRVSINLSKPFCLFPKSHTPSYILRFGEGGLRACRLASLRGLQCPSRRKYTLAAA
eukprot:scaffold3753_cov127-Isochrysis_galbana.AAC.2